MDGFFKNSCLASSFDIFYYKLPIVQPFMTSKGFLKDKEGYLIKVQDGSGAIGYGDISPLLGYSKETLRDIFELLKELSKKSQTTCSSITDLLSDLCKNKIPPSLDFALFSAYQMLKFSGPSLLTKINQLFSPQNFSDLDPIFQCKKNGIVKLKLGHLSPLKTLDLLNEITTNRPDLLLRIDLNQMWAFDDALWLTNNLPLDSIDYIEDPVASLLELYTLSLKTSCPLAADELLLTSDEELLKKIKTLKALILKPTLMSLKLLQKWVRFAKNHQIRSVLTSSFESSIGIMNIALLAKSLSLEEESLGLSTLRCFNEDVLKSPIKIHDDLLHIELKNIELRENFIKKVLSFESSMPFT